MLVLSRKRNEDLVITDRETGQVIGVRVVRIDGNKVRIGIDADRRFVVSRRECDNGGERTIIQEEGGE